MKTIVLCLACLIAFSESDAQVFSQNFNQSANLKDYVKKLSPDNGQLNAAEADGEGKVSILDGKLKLSKSGPGGRPYLVRSSPLDIQSQFLSFSFKMDVKAQGDATAYLALGNGFNKEALPDSISKSAVRLLIKLLPKGFSLRNTNQAVDGPNQYSGEQQLYWYVNRSGKTQTYTAPDGSAQTVASDRWDFWVGNTPEFDEAGFTNTKQPINSFKFSFLSSTGEIMLDDLVIDDLGK